MAGATAWVHHNRHGFYNGDHWLAYLFLEQTYVTWPVVEQDHRVLGSIGSMALESVTQACAGLAAQAPAGGILDTHAFPPK